MKSHHERTSGGAVSGALKALWAVAGGFGLLLSVQAANATSLAGESDTILRARETTEDRDLVPLYEYLHFTVRDDAKDSSLSLQVGGWGRVDLGDRSPDRFNDGDVQYGFLSFQSNKNNLVLNAGRQFIVEGVASERVDGLYVRSDLPAGFGAGAFVGTPVITRTSYTGGDLIYGGRIYHSMPNLYTLGVSALRNEATGGHAVREEEGIDLWVHPLQQVDISGRSSFNSLTHNWMEHAYNVAVSPLEMLRLSATLSDINYRDYFYQVTTSALSLTNGILNPNESVLAVGGSADLTLGQFTLTGDYKNYAYDIAGHAEYFGGQASYSGPGSFSAGVAAHRMDGETATLEYYEYRVYATQKMGKADVTLDFFDVHYDSSINGISNTFTVAAAAGFDFTANLRLVGDVDYSRTINFDHDVKGLVRLSYAFGAERRGMW